MAFLSTAPMSLPPVTGTFEALDNDVETRFNYVRWHIGDYIRGTSGLTVQQEGLYIRFLMQLYSHGRALPDDDRTMCRILSIDPRLWKRLKAELIALKKIVVYRGCLTNHRFEKERVQRAEEMQKRAAAQHARYAANRLAKAQVSGSKSVAKLQLVDSEAEKVNKINDDVAQAASPPESNSQTPLKEEGIHTAQSEPSPAAPADGGQAGLFAEAPPPDRGPPFDEYWRSYPNKSGKARAQKLWAAMSAKSRNAAIASLPAYRSCEKVLRGYVQQGDVFLSKRTWEDFASAAAPGAARGFRYAPEFDGHGAPIPLGMRFSIENSEREARDEPAMEFEDA